MLPMRNFNFRSLIEIVFKEESYYYDTVDIKIEIDGFLVIGIYEKQNSINIPIIYLEYDSKERTNFYAENKKWILEKIQINDKEKLEDHIKKWYIIKGFLTSTLRYEVGQISRKRRITNKRNMDMLNLNYAILETKNENEIVILHTFPTYLISFLNKEGDLDFLEFDSKYYKRNQNKTRMKNEDEFTKMMKIFSFKLLYG
jgi:hypothetical protein